MITPLTNKDLIGKKLYFRSPMTCASAARGQGICYKCYGDLAFVNKDINIGQIAAEGLSSIYTQILLSAKHLLESLVVKMEWTPGFHDFFQITFNSIALKEGGVFRGCSMIINEDIQVEEELDDIDYNNYITRFSIKKPDGEIIDISTTNSDNLYSTISGYSLDKYKVTCCPIDEALVNIFKYLRANAKLTLLSVLIMHCSSKLLESLAKLP